MLLGTGTAIFAAFDHKCREFILFAVNLCKHDIYISKTAVRDEHLFAVQHIMLAVFGQLGDRLGTQSVGAGTAFGQAVRRDDLARDDAGNPSLLEILGAEIQYRKQAYRGLGTKCRAETARSSDHFRDDDAGCLVEAETAVFLRDRRPEQAEIAAFFD